MKFGVREICDVVFRAKANGYVGNKYFYKDEPVIYFDSLKTSTVEGAATTVYAQGGRGNARLVAWEGERTVTFTMEDALISPVGFSILSGAGLIEADDDHKIQVHATQTLGLIQGEGTANKEYAHYNNNVLTIELGEKASTNVGAKIYVMLLENGEVISEPYIGIAQEDGTTVHVATDAAGYTATFDAEMMKKANGVLVDYYVEKTTGATQIDITADKFGGNYYVEASTLFRNTDGVDMPAEFIIPNAKIQSNFTFTMASSGDPSTFTFTMDAFPDYTRFDKTQKVFASIQIIEETAETGKGYRKETAVSGIVDDDYVHGTEDYGTASGKNAAKIM